MTISESVCSPIQDRRCVEATEFLRQRWPQSIRVGIILGTGLGQLANSIASQVEVPYEKIPHFPRTTALSHAGRLVCGTLGRVPVIAFDGRCHLYEGYRADEITLPISVLRALGAELLIVSNASGGLNPRFRAGDIMIMANHINLMGRRTAELGISDTAPSRSGRTSPYDSMLIDAALEIARQEGFVCHQGTYVAVLGPNYETRAEYRAMRRLGGDVVGMSTVPEVLAAIRCGLRVLGLSTVTNVANPDDLSATNAQDVVDVAATAEPKLRQIVLGVIERFLRD